MHPYPRADLQQAIASDDADTSFAYSLKRANGERALAAA